MRKLLITATVAVWSGVAAYSVADVAVHDSQVKSDTSAIKTNTDDLKEYVGANVDENGGSVNENLGKNNSTTYDEYGVTVEDKGSVRANQVKLMDIFQGNRKKTEDGTGTDDPKLKPLDPKDRDYLNTKPNDTAYSGDDNKYATAATLPSKYCSDIEESTTDGVTTYQCSGTSGFKGAKSASDSTEARKKLVVDFSTGTDNEIIKESEKAAELYAQRIAIHQAMAQEAYARTTLRYEKIQQFLDDIKNATDPKAIFDLQARVQAEQAMLQNEQNQLLALSQMQQSERDMYEQKKIEINKFRKQPDPNKNSPGYASKVAIVDAGVTALNASLIAAEDMTTVKTALGVGMGVAAFAAASLDTSNFLDLNF